VRRVCVAIGSRANYGSLKAVMRAVALRRDLELQVLAFASAITDDYGSTWRRMKDDGFPVTALRASFCSGKTKEAMATTAGLALLQHPNTFGFLGSEVVVVCGDRHEVLGCAAAAAYASIPVAHTMGGEVSGTLDEGVRHAISKLATIHFPATRRAAVRLMAMGEDPANIHVVGCPRIDTVKAGLASFDWPQQNFLMVSQHPVTTEADKAGEQILTTLEAVHKLGLVTHLFWPNCDAGSEEIDREIRRAKYQFSTHRKMGPEEYSRLMAQTACLVGNSSSGIREGAWLGTPVVNVGSRQAGRERGKNVIDVEHNVEAIETAIRWQIAHGRYEQNTLYGDGYSGERIAEVLAGPLPPVQKRWHEEAA
jgi:UDP-hydrolysing UDP-N-acetyl-D-glucosamine 2-epimerase